MSTYHRHHGLEGTRWTSRSTPAGCDHFVVNRELFECFRFDRISSSLAGKHDYLLGKIGLPANNTKTIARDLHGNATDTFWVGTAYLLPCAALQPFLCALSDAYGRRFILLFSITLFAIGSVVGSVAQNMATILAGRTIQGIGGGGLIPLPMIVMTDLFALRERPKYTAYIQLFSAIGIIIGPVMGGLFTQHAADHGGWRWVFYVNFPFCLIAFVVLFFALRKMKVTRESYRNIDWLGSFFFTSSMVCFLMGLSWGGTLYKWNSYRTLLPLCLGAVGIVCTIIWECYGARWPFLPLSILKSPASIAVYLSSLVQGISVSVLLVRPHNCAVSDLCSTLDVRYPLLHYVLPRGSTEALSNTDGKRDLSTLRDNGPIRLDNCHINLEIRKVQMGPMERLGRGSPGHRSPLSSG